MRLAVSLAVVLASASLILPPLSRAKSRAQSIYCLNNLRQLGLSLQMYAGDNDDVLPYNMGTDGTRKTVADGTFLNWVNNVMTWELDSLESMEFSISHSFLADECIWSLSSE